MIASSVARMVRSTFLVCSLPFLVAVGTSCGSDKKEDVAPELKQFLVQGPGGESADLLMSSDGGVGAVSPLSQFKAVFNALLDGTKIETVSMGKTEAKTDVASITWLEAPAGAPAVTAATSYNPAGFLDVRTPGPSVIVQPSPGLPSGATLRITLDAAKITSKGGKSFVGAVTHTIETQPFAASSKFEEAVVKITFSNVPSSTAKDHIKVHGAGNEAVAVTIAPDTKDPLTLLVTPTSTTWTEGVTYTVLVAADAADQFGVKLAQEHKSSFRVANDGGTSGQADGGADDSGTGVDGGADLATAPDLAIELDSSASVD